MLAAVKDPATARRRGLCTGRALGGIGAVCSLGAALFAAPALAAASPVAAIQPAEPDPPAPAPDSAGSPTTGPAPTAADPGAAEATAEPRATGPVTAEPDATADADATEPATAEPDATADADAAEFETADADTTEAESADASVSDEPAPRPPRIDGPYLGGTVFGGIALARVNDFPTDGAFTAFGATLSVGQMVFPWLGLGLHGGGGGAVSSQDGARQSMGQGYLGIEFKFVPLPKRLPLSLRAAFGFGGGAVRQAGITARSGYGGAQFGAGVRYEWFPWANKRRPAKGGGFGLGPELGWIGFTPAAPDRPMSNTIYLALATTFYFGS